jgi:hypothetical protein
MLRFIMAQQQKSCFFFFFFFLSTCAKSGAWAYIALGSLGHKVFAAGNQVTFDDLVGKSRSEGIGWFESAAAVQRRKEIKYAHAPGIEKRLKKNLILFTS